MAERTDGWMDGQRDGGTEGQTDRQTDGRTEKRTDEDKKYVLGHNPVTENEWPQRTKQPNHMPVFTCEHERNGLND